MSSARIIIAGTNSGCGKTTITIGVIAALIKKGLIVQPFKTGPDYIDPMFHTFITGRISRNLDSWILEEETVAELYIKNSIGSDISIIEGVMGLYDGFGGTSDLASTAHLSRILKAPVILVVNGEGMSLSVAALVHGFKSYGNGADIRGVILNGIKSKQYFDLLKDIIESNTGVKVLGYVPFLEGCSLESRHLGLIPTDEIIGLQGKIDKLAEEIAKTVDLEMILRLAKEAQDSFNMSTTKKIHNLSMVKEILLSTNLTSEKISQDKVRIGVAKDSAFNFYYQDNLDLLEKLGAEIIYFSPLKDLQLPQKLDGLYIGGGYPEEFAQQLQDNFEMRKSILDFINAEKPTYAECGGMMYLCKKLIGKNGVSYDMVGALPKSSRMTTSLKRFGYAEMEVTEDCVLAQKYWTIRVHEFHYSETESLYSNDHDKIPEDSQACIPTCMMLSKKCFDGSVLKWNCGYKYKNLVAGYPHIHFLSNIAFAERFLDKCKEQKEREKICQNV